MPHRKKRVLCPKFGLHLFCIVFPTICGAVKKKPRGLEIGMEGGVLERDACRKTVCFFHVWSVSVVPSVSVESAMVCQLRIDDVFRTVSLSGTAKSEGQCSQHSSHGCLATFFDRSKVPANPRDWQEEDAGRPAL